MELIFKKDNRRYEIKNITMSGDTAYFTIEVNGEEYMWESTCFRSPTDYTKDPFVTLTDTIELMTSDNYKDRLVAEYVQLAMRRDRLMQIIEDANSGRREIPLNCSISLLLEQEHAMTKYMMVLEQRFEQEGINHIQGWYDCLNGIVMRNIPF